MEVWYVAVPVMIRVLKFGKRVIVRWPFHPRVIDANFLPCPQIVIDDHAPRADDGHFANLPWIEPGALDVGEALTREGERHVCHVFYVWRAVHGYLVVYCSCRLVELVFTAR